jgi:cell division protein FtsN
MKTGPAVISSDAAKALDIAQNDQTKVQIIAVRAAERTSITPTIDELNESDSTSIGTELSKPYIQVGIFGVQNNANKTKTQMLQLNIPVNILDFQIKGKPYWRVVAGPASTSDNRRNMLKTINSAGFTDAYFISN